MSTRCKACDRELNKIAFRSVLVEKKLFHVLEDLCHTCRSIVYNLPEMKQLSLPDVDVLDYEEEDS